MGRSQDQDVGTQKCRPSGWVVFSAVVVACALGVLGGLGSFTFGYGDGAAYLKNDPQACANCHVMQTPFDTWVKSSHRSVATCNDCHLSHSPIAKWATKADNGFFHSLAFTTGAFPDPIRIKPRNRRVTQAACLHCHRELVNHMLPAARFGDMLWCIQCHASAGHAQR
ncbi:MAG: cytochrome c nitrite reductase small subunit [Thermoanaerobaculales bacterium]|nr:cytochrome c nitrite reductase small subunit [Thermoanaerobaculales bacterium]